VVVVRAYRARCSGGDGAGSAPSCDGSQQCRQFERPGWKPVSSHGTCKHNTEQRSAVSAERLLSFKLGVPKGECMQQQAQQPNPDPNAYLDVSSVLTLANAPARNKTSVSINVASRSNECS
jgi:hypothetical protein